MDNIRKTMQDFVITVQGFYQKNRRRAGA